MRSTGLLDTYSEARRDHEVPDAGDPVTVVACNGKSTNRCRAARPAESTSNRRGWGERAIRQCSRCERSDTDHCVFRRVTVSPLHN